jgi:DNA/RNA-binding protein KIN17
MNKQLKDGAYYNKKGVVTGVFDLYGATVRMLDNGHKLRLDQEDLETVIPASGGALMIVNGRYRGKIARMVQIHPEDFNCDVVLCSGPRTGTVVRGLEYEDVCKLVQEEDEDDEPASR